MKKLFSIVIVSVLLFSLAGFVFAQGRELEIEYPEIAGEQPEETTTPVTEYFKYIFNFLIWISGIIALVVLTNAGFQYFTSAGNPEAMNDAKGKIAAALLGILILFGSYLILTTINPDLIVFRLPRLRPIISELSAGVLLCTEEVKVGRAWQLTNNFKQAEEYGEQRIIARELKQIIEDISGKCAVVTGRGNVDTTFRFVYFIPGEQTIDGERYISLYGAIFYEGESFEGKSQPMYEHLEKGLMMYYPVKYGPDEPIRKITISQLSSIEPFVLIPNHDGGYEINGVKYQVFLFQEYNKNLGTDLEDKGRTYSLSPENWWHEWDWSRIKSGFGSLPGAVCEENFCSPRSIQVIGDYIVILVTPDGRSETFPTYNTVDSNLDDNLNIVNWVDCKDYQSDVKKTCQKYVSGGFGGGSVSYNCCAKTAVKNLIIISAKPY